MPRPRLEHALAVACALATSASAAQSGTGRASSGAPRTAVVATGECQDPELLGATRALGGELSTLGALTVVDEPDRLARIVPSSVKSFDEVQRQIDGAQDLYYQAQYARAIRQVESALEEIARQPPGERRWKLEVGARILEGLIRTRLRGDASKHEAFRRVLRLDPAYRLDPDYFGPSTINLFEKVRRDMARAPRPRLEVTSTPSGADVFLDGKSVGRTPLRAAFPEGTYQLLVGSGARLSFARTVDLAGETAIHVDLGFEAAVVGERPLCLAGTGEDAARVNDAAKLGAALAVDRVVLVRLDSRALTAALVDVAYGATVREGSVQLAGEAPSPPVLRELARFVATGERTARVIPPPPSAAPAAPAAAPEPTAVAATPDLQIDPARRSRSRPAAFAAGGVGIAAAGTGVVLLVLSGASRGTLEDLRADGIQADEAARARELFDELSFRQTAGWVALGVGAVALAGGVAMYASDRPLTRRTGAWRLLVVPTRGGAALGFGAAF